MTIHQPTFGPPAPIQDPTYRAARRARRNAAPLPAGTLPVHGVDRPTIAPEAFRYDLDDRISRDLEMAANAILRAAGDQVHAIDVVDRYTRRPFVMPQRVLGRVARYKRPAVRYYSKVQRSSLTSWSTVRNEYRTDVVGYGYSFVGFTRVTPASAVRASSAGTRSGGNTRGRKFAPFAADDRSIRRKWATATADAVTLAASIAATLHETGTYPLGVITDAEVEMTPGELSVVVHHRDADGTARPIGQTFTVESFARRVALATHPTPRKVRTSR